MRAAVQNVDDEPVPSVFVSSADVGGCEALRLYQQGTQDLFATRIPDRPIEDFRLSMRVWHLGALMIGAVDSSPQIFERTPTMVATSGIDLLMVQLYREGGYEGTVGSDGRSIRVEPGDVCVLDMSDTLETRTSDFRNITIVIPRSIMEAALGDVGALHGLVMTNGHPLTNLIGQNLESLLAGLDTMTVGEAGTAARATVALIGAVLAHYQPAPTEQRKSIASPLRDMTRYIDSNLGNPELSADSLIDTFAVSRATLYRLFAPVGGVSEFIRRRRLSGAAIELAGPGATGMRVSEVSRRWGFTSEATFSRAFRNQFGLSPREAHKRAGMNWQVLSGVVHEETSRGLAVWLKTLRQYE